MQGVRPLWEPDEGRYVAVALEMLRSGDYLNPRLHPEVPHFTKPPLTYWAVAGSIGLLGHHEGAARLPNSLALFGTILLVAGMARRLAPGCERTAGIVYATSLLPFVGANIVTTDTLLALFTTLGAWGLVELRWGRVRPALARLALWGGFGAAFLTKGLPGLLPAAGLLIAAAATREAAPDRGRRPYSLKACALFLLLAFGWYGLEIWRQPGLLDYLLGKEVAGRIGSAEFDRNAGLAGWFKAYGPVLLAGLLPWWPLAVLRSRRGQRPAGCEAAPGADRFLAIWLLVPLAVFSLAQSRLPLYLLPLAAPAALLATRRIGPLGRDFRGRLAVLAWVALLLVLKLYSGSHETNRDGRSLAAQLRGQLPWPPYEILFVEDSPRYTLSFYLDCEIEEIDLATVDRQRSPAFRPVADPLAAELLDPEPARVFLVPKWAAGAFASELAALGASSRRIGEVDRWAIHLVDPAPAG